MVEREQTLRKINEGNSLGIIGEPARRTIEELQQKVRGWALHCLQQEVVGRESEIWLRNNISYSIAILLFHFVFLRVHFRTKTVRSEYLHSVSLCGGSSTLHK